MKGLLLGNLSTKAMALFLAVLTWMYLYTQDTGYNDLEVLFLPKIEARDFATLQFSTSDGRVLVPGEAFQVRVTGPKGEVRALRPRTYKCEPSIAPQSLGDLQGRKDIVLQRRDFDLPDKFGVDPLPSSTLTLRYVRFVTRTIRILAGPGDYTGSPAPDHVVESITPVPAEIEARIPADRGDLREFPIHPVSLDQNREDLTVLGALQDPTIQPLQSFQVRVRIVPLPRIARMTLDLNLCAKPENLKRLELEDKSILIEIRGPEELVREAEKRPAVFQPYVIVADTDMEPPGNHTISQLGCHVLDPKFQGRLTVVLMPDVKPENRTVKIKVAPRVP